jgi:hypothetical protein
LTGAHRPGTGPVKAQPGGLKVPTGPMQRPPMRPTGAFRSPSGKTGALPATRSPTGPLPRPPGEAGPAGSADADPAEGAPTVPVRRTGQLRKPSGRIAVPVRSAGPSKAKVVGGVAAVVAVVIAVILYFLRFR